MPSYHPFTDKPAKFLASRKVTRHVTGVVLTGTGARASLPLAAAACVRLCAYSLRAVPCSGRVPAWQFTASSRRVLCVSCRLARSRTTSSRRLHPTVGFTEPCASASRSTLRRRAWTPRAQCRACGAWRLCSLLKRSSTAPCTEYCSPARRLLCALLQQCCTASSRSVAARWWCGGRHLC
jgi:hypothetical protein